MKLINKSFIIIVYLSIIFYMMSIIKIDSNLVLKAQSIDLSYDTKYVALTFDDGPKNDTTEKLLDELEKRNVKVTFFLLGTSAETYPDIVKRIYEDGHQIGNHSYNHKNLRGLNEEEIEYQIEKTNEIIKDITDEKPSIFRPAYGLYNQKVYNNNDMPIILWSVDTNDWKIKKASKLYDRNINKIKDGDIILMHDIFKSSVEASLMIIDELQSIGFKFVTIAELSLIKDIPLMEDEVYFDFH